MARKKCGCRKGTRRIKVLRHSHFAKRGKRYRAKLCRRKNGTFAPKKFCKR